MHKRQSASQAYVSSQSTDKLFSSRDVCAIVCFSRMACLHTHGAATGKSVTAFFTSTRSGNVQTAMEVISHPLPKRVRAHREPQTEGTTVHGNVGIFRPPQLSGKPPAASGVSAFMTLQLGVEPLQQTVGRGALPAPRAKSVNAVSLKAFVYCRAWGAEVYGGKMASGERNKFGAPMFEPKVFREQMYCIENRTCDMVVFFFDYPSDLAPGTLCAPSVRPWRRVL